MRATVTIADELFERADRAAKRLGMSRSRFYQQAVEAFLRRLTEEQLTERMDAFVESHGQQLRESFEPYVKAAWGQELRGDEW